MNFALETRDAGAWTCAWCGAAAAPPSGGAGIAWCTRCGAGTTTPLPTEKELDDAYAGWYRPETGRFSGPGDTLLRLTRGTLARRLDRVAPPGPVLDVGSGDGSLLDALAGVGREAKGLERSSDRLDTRPGRVAEIEGRWAAVVFWHSLEHLPDGAEALGHAAGLLAPEGVLIVAVPNPASLQARVFGARWFGFDLPRHLVHLPLKTLTARLGELGLEVGRVSHLRAGQVLFGWLHGLVGLLPGRPSLYDAIRRSDARRRPISGPRRWVVLLAAALLAPLAAIMAGVEVLARRGGTVYVEAMRR